MLYPAGKARNIGFLPLILVALSIGLLAAGLWPFRFFPRNNVQWIDGRSGLRFDKYGIAYGREPLFGPGGAIDLARPFTIRMEVRPREEPSDSVPRILSAYVDDGRELFFLGQWRDELILRILDEKRTLHLPYREAGAGGLKKDVMHSIVVRSEKNDLRLFVDGAPAGTMVGVDFSLLSDRQGPARMILGNSPTGKRTWRGDLLSLSFFPKALSPAELEYRGNDPVVRYDFSERSDGYYQGGADYRHDLLIPRFFRAPKKGILVPRLRVQKYDRSFWKDVFVNILGFIPFGFAAYAWLRKNGERKSASVTVIALLLGAGISLFIELMQVYLPTRDSSFTDVMTNVLGTYFGAQLFRAAHAILYR